MGAKAVPDYFKYRSMLMHLIVIDQAIRSGRHPNTRTLAEELELAERTVARKVEFMRDALGAPIKYNPQRRGYYYSEQTWSLPSVQITEGDFLGLAMAEIALQAYKGTPLEVYLRKFSEKIAASLPQTVDVVPSDLPRLFRVDLGPVAAFDPKHWEALARAVRERRVVRMTYHSMYKGKVREQTVEPYLLRCFRGDWYLIARDPESGYVPMYSLARIKALKALDKTFDPPADFDPETYFGGTFGVSHKAERHEVRIRFAPEVARYIEERKWHPSQHLTGEKDGSVILTMTVGDLEEVGRWLLTWGPAGTALAPPALAHFVHQTAVVLTARYAQIVPDVAGAPDPD